MAAAKRKSIAKLCLALGLFVLAGFFRQADRVGAPLPSAAFFLLTNLIYIGLAMGWGFSISRRILHRCDRRWLLLGCAMAVLWLFLRTVKYRFFNDDTVTRYLWYLYYVPQILAPLFSLFAALQLGRRDGDTFSLRWYLLFIPAICLIGGVLTNDLHQMAFRAAPGAATLSADYMHGWVYYLAMAWIVVLLLATGAVIYCKCRVSESRRYAWVPLCVFLGGFALCALSFANIYTFHKIPECCCLTFAAFWESCLQVGLLPTNDHYRYFFSESTVAAQIVDEAQKQARVMVDQSEVSRRAERPCSPGSSFGRRRASPSCWMRIRGCKARRCRTGACTGWRIFQKSIGFRRSLPKSTPGFRRKTS